MLYMVWLLSKVLKVVLQSRIWSTLLNGLCALEKSIFYGKNVNLVDCISPVFSTLLQGYLVLLSALQILCILLIDVCGNRASSKSISPIFLATFAHFVCLSQFGNLQYFKPFHYYICYGVLWSLIFHVTVVIRVLSSFCILKSGMYIFFVIMLLHT